MAHKCTKCGREFADGSTEILRGCPSCAGKKFLYVRESECHTDVPEEKPIEELTPEKKQETPGVQTGPQKDVQIYDRVESIRILGPGSYELNIEKLAKSDEVVVGLAKEGQYIVDIPSMARSIRKVAKRKPRKKKKGKE
jgi:predicted  nucleic acid-binding Zn-ribbon protein